MFFVPVNDVCSKLLLLSQRPTAVVSRPSQRYLHVKP